MRDLKSRIAPVAAIAPAVYSADTTPGAVDLRGFGSAVILINVGVGGITFTAANKIEFVLTHSDDDATYTPVTDADVQGVTGITGGIVKALTAAQAAATIDEIGYVGGKRYLKLLADFSGTHSTGTAIAALVIKGHPEIFPA
ncbi:hypothetical protein [Phaeospirillum tilakii]|uniref:Bacteriophage lambda head decoration protein D n=1 Tax=Phaeospirillum tilakii TaxID=741673 RepID=A0ABW5CFL1_9PROT